MIFPPDFGGKMHTNPSQAITRWKITTYNTLLNLKSNQLDDNHDDSWDRIYCLSLVLQLTGVDRSRQCRQTPFRLQIKGLPFKVLDLDGFGHLACQWFCKRACLLHGEFDPLWAVSRLAMFPHSRCLIFLVEESQMFSPAWIHIPRGFSLVFSKALEAGDLVCHATTFAISSFPILARKTIISTTLSTRPWIGPL